MMGDNRKELLVTFDIELQAKVRTALANKKIEYDVKVINQNSRAANHGARYGVFGESRFKNCEYIVYVKKSDYEEARFVLSFVNR